MFLFFLSFQNSSLIFSFDRSIFLSSRTKLLRRYILCNCQGFDVNFRFDVNFKTKDDINSMFVQFIGRDFCDTHTFFSVSLSIYV